MPLRRLARSLFVFSFFGAASARATTPPAAPDSAVTDPTPRPPDAALQQDPDDGDAALQQAPLVEVLTMTPGPHLFERFGHTALRIGDRVYNFGTFDPGDPQVVAKFLSHTLDYWLSVAALDAHYDRYENRTITAQAIALTPAESFALAAAHAQNALPEHRAYRYDFFADNCATRVRDALDRATAGTLSASVRGLPGTATYRGHVEHVLAPAPLAARAISLLLNAYTDAPITRWDDAFLPSELQAILASARRSDGRLLVARTTVTPVRAPERAASSTPPSPFAELLLEVPILLLFLGPLAAAAMLHRSKIRRRRVLTGIALIEVGLACGLLGVVLTVTSLTPYRCAHENANLLLFQPLLLALVPAGAFVIAGRARAFAVARMVVVVSLGPVAIDLALHAIGSARQHNTGLALGMLAVDLLLLVATWKQPVPQPQA